MGRFDVIHPDRRRLLVLAALALVIVSGSKAAGSEGTVTEPGGRNGLIAFDSNGDIWVANADGSGRQQLTFGPAFDFSPMWSPDGTEIAFWSMTSDADANESGLDIDAYLRAVAAPVTSLVVMRSDGFEPRSLVEGLVLATSSAPTLAVPSWSPDGTRIAYGHFVDGSPVIDLIPVAGGEPTRLVAPGKDPSWSPDGRLVAYQGGATEADSGIYLVGADGTDPHRLTQEPTTGGDVFSAPQWSPDGTTILYFAGIEGTSDVWAVDVDGTDERVFIGRSGNEYRAAFSPDGNRIAFDRTKESPDIVRFVVAASDGSGEVPLESPPLFGLQPVWAPEGDFLVGYHADPGYASPSLLVVDVTGEQPAVEISTDGNIGLASWQRLAP
jgi:Tol biopolymer transport system component